MTKRNPGLPRNPRDEYPTPAKALVPAFLRHLAADGYGFVEPCCGNGELVWHLQANGFRCDMANDIKHGGNAMDLKQVKAAIVTNPPWDRKLLHPMILHFVGLDVPVWLLLDADWMHTRQAVPFLHYCTHIVSIGRVRWMAGTKMDGFDNCAWYRFSLHPTGAPQFIARS